MMTIQLAIFITVILGSLFIFARSEVVYAARCAELRRANAEAILTIAGTGLSGDWRGAYRAFDESPPFDMMMFDLTKWTHAQFYPRLEGNT